MSKMKVLDTAIGLGRMAEPTESASAVAVLASDGGSYIDGTSIFVDGGLMHSRCAVPGVPASPGR